MMQRFAAYLFFACLWLTPGLALAQTAVFPAQVTNLSEEEGAAITAVLADAYAEASPDPVTLAGEPRDEEGHAVPPTAAAQQLQAKEYVTISATRLSQNIIISAARYSQSGEELYRVRMTAASLDDVETVAARMAKALVTRTDTSETLTIDTVTEREGEKKNRTFSEKVIGVKTGFDWVFSSSDFEPMISVGFDARLEAKHYFLEFGAGFALPASGGDGSNVDVGGVYAEFGGSYYLTHTSISPYIGAGVMPRLLGGDDMDGGANLALYVQGGAMFFRESSSRLYTDLRLAQNLTSWSRTTYDYSTTTGTVVQESSRYPTELILEVGIGW